MSLVRQRQEDKELETSWLHGKSEAKQGYTSCYDYLIKAKHTHTHTNLTHVLTPELHHCTYTFVTLTNLRLEDGFLHAKT